MRPNAQSRPATRSRLLVVLAACCVSLFGCLLLLQVRPAPHHPLLVRPHAVFLWVPPLSPSSSPSPSPSLSPSPSPSSTPSPSRSPAPSPSRSRSLVPSQARRQRPVAPAAPRPKVSCLSIRVVTNDFPPLFRRGRTLASLRYRVQHERKWACAELYILDRLVEGEDKQELLELLHENGLATPDVVERPLVPGDTSAQELWDQAGALNLALEQGKQRGFHWMLVLDSTVFVTTPAWASLVKQFQKPGVDTVLMPTVRLLKVPSRAALHFSGPYEIPQFALKSSSTDPSPFRPSPPGSFAHVIDFLVPRCTKIFSGDPPPSRCSRVNRAVIRLYSYPATEEMAVHALSPQLRQMALVLGAELLAAKARVVAGLEMDLPPSADDLAAVEVARQLEGAHAPNATATGKPLLRLGTTTLRDIAELRIADGLHEVHRGLSPPSSRVPRMMCGRVLGNDIPPLQMHGQTFTNLWYALKHEARQTCEHVFVVNRVLHEEMASKLVQLLEANGFTLGSEILVREIDWTLPMVEVNVKYLADVNGARNLAWDEGLRRGAEWIDLVDGGEFGTRALWEDMIRKIQDPHPYPMLLKPMVRLRKLQEPSWLNADTKLQAVPSGHYAASQEPQVVLPSNSSLRFDTALEYGNVNKLAVLVIECGAAYVRSNADLSDSSPCVVLDEATFRLFSFRAPTDAHHRPTRNQNRIGLRDQGKKLMLGAARSLWRKRSGTPPTPSDEQALRDWQRQPSEVEWTEQGLKVPASLSFVANP